MFCGPGRPRPTPPRHIEGRCGDGPKRAGRAGHVPPPQPEGAPAGSRGRGPSPASHRRQRLAAPGVVRLRRRFAPLFHPGSLHPLSRRRLSRPVGVVRNPCYQVVAASARASPALVLPPLTSPPARFIAVSLHSSLSFHNQLCASLFVSSFVGGGGAAGLSRSAPRGVRTVAVRSVRSVSVVAGRRGVWGWGAWSCSVVRGRLVRRRARRLRWLGGWGSCACCGASVSLRARGARSGLLACPACLPSA
jgi:hypothetical protein